MFISPPVVNDTVQWKEELNKRITLNLHGELEEVLQIHVFLYDRKI